MMDAVVDGGTRGTISASPRAKDKVQLHGQSSETLALQQEIERVARSDAKVLITGKAASARRSSLATSTRAVHARRTCLRR